MILKVKGIPTTVRNAGRYSENSIQVFQVAQDCLTWP
jgi:hypothetical protein